MTAKGNTVIKWPLFQSKFGIKFFGHLRLGLDIWEKPLSKSAPGYDLASLCPVLFCPAGGIMSSPAGRCCLMVTSPAATGQLRPVGRSRAQEDQVMPRSKEEPRGPSSRWRDTRYLHRPPLSLTLSEPRTRRPLLCPWPKVSKTLRP